VLVAIKSICNVFCVKVQLWYRPHFQLAWNFLPLAKPMQSGQN
jgi:hypothetical protein